MKQTLLMYILLLFGVVGAFVKGPFYGAAVYYLFAILRPQYIWDWALPPGMRWSFYVAIATIAASLLWLRSDSRNGWLKPGSTAMLLFGLWVTLSYFFAIDSDVAFKYYIEYLKIFVMFFISILIVREFSQIRVLYLVAVISLGYLAYEINALYFFSHRLDVFHYGYGGLDNNGAGLTIAMGIPMAYFLWQAYTRWWRWLFLAIIPVMLHAVLMSYSRGAMVSLIIAVPLLTIRSVNRKSMIAVVVCLLMLLPFLAGKEMRDRFFSVQQYEQDKSAQSRFDSWKAALGIALDHPILGVGVRNSALFSKQYGADMEGRTIHSIYLQIAADSGFPAMGFYLATFFIAWRTLRRFQKQYRNSYEHRLAYNLACGLEAALAVFLIGGVFLSLETFELPYLLILLALQLPASVPVEEVSFTRYKTVEFEHAAAPAK